MTTAIESRVRPKAGTDFRAPSRPRTVGLVLAGLGLIVTLAAFIASLVVAGDASLRAETLPWAFGLTTLGFGTVKLGIGVILWGILMKLWLRWDSIKEALANLVKPGAAVADGADYKSAFGTATVTAKAPDALPIHRMAKKMWRPMLAMGYMAVVVGFVISLAWASGGGIVSSAWTQGLQFLGEAMLLAGVSFLLGTILWAIRTGGGETQEGLGVAVHTLKMPVTAKVFVALMALGLMVGVAQFVGYLIVAGGGVHTAAWLAFLGPLRELALALILSGITLALVTIGSALGFQFDRVIQLLETGK